MSIKLMSMVFDHQVKAMAYDAPGGGKPHIVSGSTAKLVLLALADYSNDTGHNIYPSTETLARKTSLAERSVRFVMGALVQNGYIQYTHTSRLGTPQYRMVVSKLTQAPESSSPRGESDSGVAESDSPHAESDSPVAESDSQNAESDSPNPSFNHQLNRQFNARAAQPESDEFSKIQALVEKLTGYPSTPKDVPAINEMVSLGIIEDDLRAALAWFKSTNHIARGAAGILSSAKRARAERIQAQAAKPGNGKASTTLSRSLAVLDRLEQETRRKNGE